MKQFYFSCLLLLTSYSTLAQISCPSNIGFEQGDFTNWQCYTGWFSISGCTASDSIIYHPVATSPIAQRYSILPQSSQSDPFGGFPISPSNSGNFVARLGGVGQIQTTEQLERLTYTFTIPSNVTEYSITYQFAAVHQVVNHCGKDDPHFAARVYDVTDGRYIDCASRLYYPTATNGFLLSSQMSMGSQVRYKPWTTVTLLLSSYIGHTLRLEFTNGDCAPVGGHWAYAYVDVINACGSPGWGNEFCPGSSAAITAPYGFQTYNWWNNNFTQGLGNSQILNIPSPASLPTVYAVDLNPAAGLGCRDTVYVTVKPKNTIAQANAGPDTSICAIGPGVIIGTPAVPGLAYSWSPAIGTGLPIAQPLVTPASTTKYVVTATDAVTGCTAIDSVLVTVLHVPAATISVNGNVFTSSSPTANQWYLDGNAITGATGQTYTATISGAYTVVVTSNSCQSPHSNSISFKPTSIDAVAREWQLQLRPNPVTDNLLISYNGVNRLDVEIMDLTGRLLYSRADIPAATVIDLSKFTTGNYLLRLFNNRTKQEVKQLIVKL